MAGRQRINRGGKYAVWATSNQVGETLQIEGPEGTFTDFDPAITTTASPVLYDLPGNCVVQSSTPTETGSLFIKGDG
jgi:hypothetical protein